MNVSNIAQLATTMSNQRLSIDMSVAVAKLANSHVEAQGQAAMQLIESASKPQGSLGHHIDVKA